MSISSHSAAQRPPPPPRDNPGRSSGRGPRGTTSGPSTARGALSAAGLAGVLVLAGCGGDDDSSVAPTTNPACTPAPTPAPALTGPMAAFDLTGIADVVRVYEDDGFFVVNALATGPIPDLTTKFFSVVEEAGYSVAGSDDEGFEAEIFFATGQVAAGQVILTEADCPGVVDVKITLLDSPDVLPGGDSSAAPTETSS